MGRLRPSLRLRITVTAGSSTESRVRCRLAQGSRSVHDKVGPMEMRDPAHHVSSRAIVFWTVRAVPGWLLVMVGQLLWLLVAQDQTGLRFIALAVTVLLAATHLLVMPQWRYRVHRWEVHDNDVPSTSGWSCKAGQNAPISRVHTGHSARVTL